MASLRSIIGLCDHRWVDEGEVHTKRANAFRTSINEPAVMLVGINRVQRCTICGKVRSVRL